MPKSHQQKLAEMRRVSTKAAIMNLGCRIMAQVRFPQLLHSFLLPSKLTILVYHGVIRSPLEIYNWCFLDERSFRNQIEYLKAHFEVLSLSEAVERMLRGSISRPTAVITFDDGYQNNYDVAFPILRQANLPATIFVTTGLVDTDDTFWNLRLNRALANTSARYLGWNGSCLDLSGPGSKLKAEAVVRAAFRQLPRPNLLPALRNVILELGDDPDSPIEADSPFRMLKSGAISEMQSSGLIEFGAHSHTHPSLSRISAEEREKEISLSVTRIRELTGRSCELFAYPFGQLCDYSTETVRILQNYGVRIAVTGIAGANDKQTSPMELRRYGVGADYSMPVFEAKAHHVLAQLLRMIR